MSETSHAMQVLQFSHYTINLWLKRSASTDYGSSASGEGGKVGDRDPKYSNSKHDFTSRSKS
ncbi:MAG TPA: hypothetical protein VK211_23355 [Kamptonema sp.]|nr:hypothetical protein [Kamptonema sp.]